MTTTTSSPNRFGKYLRWRLKENSTMMIFLLVLSFVVLPLSYLTKGFSPMVTPYGLEVYPELVTKDFAGIYVGGSIVFISMVWIAATFILAVCSTHYMQNKRAVDLYHALPVTRTKMICANILSTFFTVSFPLTISYGIDIILMVIRHNLAPASTVCHVGLAIFELFGWYVSCFSVIVIVHLVASLVGSTFDTVLFSGIFLFTLPAYYGIHELLCDCYLYGYCDSINSKVLIFLSPEMIMPGYYIMKDEKLTWFIIGIVIWFILNLILLWLTGFLYRNRPSERAETPSISGCATYIFKFIVISIGSIGFGSVLCDLTDLPILLSTLIMGLLVSFFFEAVLGRGFKGVRLKTFFIDCCIILVTLAYLFVLMSGGLGFENRVPSENEIESIEIDYRGRYSNISLYDVSKPNTYYDYSSEETKTYYNSVEEFTLVDPESISAILDLHRSVLAFKAQDTMEDEPVFENNNSNLSITISYRLKNGTTMNRSYYCPVNDCIEEPLQTVEELKEIALQFNPFIATASDSSCWKEVRITGLDSESYCVIDDSLLISRLVSALSEDSLNESEEQFYNTSSTPIAYLYFVSDQEESCDKVEENYFGSFSWMVPSYYTETIKVLKEYGLYDTLIQTDSNLVRLVVYNCSIVPVGTTYRYCWNGDLSTQNDFSYSIMLSPDEYSSLISLATCNTPSDGALFSLALGSYSEDGSEQYSILIPIDAAAFFAADFPRVSKLLADYFGSYYYLGNEYSYNYNTSSWHILSYEDD